MNSGKINKNHFSRQVAALLPVGSRVLAGLSGGIDSVVLLHLLQQLSPHYSWQLSALHVHHGISRNAGAWADFCTRLCARYGISLHIEHVDIAPLREHGIEAAARKLRYRAFARQSCDFVALAHHADDQAETLLLQLLRGAGVRGASAMPQLAECEGSPGLVRPLLNFSRQEIHEYAVMHHLQWIEDESNADDSYPRNFLRHRVLPLLEQKFPACHDTLARSAQHFAEASSLLDELAQQDAAQAMQADTLAVSVLQSLEPPRARNLLRYFLHRIGAPMPQAVQLNDMLQQLCCARRDAAVCVEYGSGDTLPAKSAVGVGRWQVRRYQGKVYAMRAPGDFDRNLLRGWHGEAELDWPALNMQLRFERTISEGISLTKLQRAPIMLRLRCGGETLRPSPNGPTRTLKNLLQEHCIPPWQRDRLPLLYCGDDLACVPGIAIAAQYQATEGETGISVNLLCIEIR